MLGGELAEVLNLKLSFGALLVQACGIVGAIGTMVAFSCLCCIICENLQSRCSSGDPQMQPCGA